MFIALTVPDMWAIFPMISRVFKKQEHKVSYRCSLPSPLQKRSKDYKELHWCQNPAEDLLGFSAPHVPIFEDLFRLLPSLLVFSLRFEILLFWVGGPEGAWGHLQRIWVLVGHLAQWGPLLGSGTNEILCNPWISSAMAMAMSIYRTLCVLV